MKTNAQRQAEYRRRRPTAGNIGERRLNTWLTSEASWAIRRLAYRYGVTQRQFLEQLIIAEEDKIVDSLDPRDQEEWDAYFNRPFERRSPPKHNSELDPT